MARGISDKVVTSELVIILTRSDAAEFGDENLYIDGVPYQLPVQFEPFRQAIEERLAGGAKKFLNTDPNY